MKTKAYGKSAIVLVASILCLMAGLFLSPVKAEAATTKAKVVLEFTDGTQKTWKTGDTKIKLGKKELAYVYFGEYPQTEVTGKKLTKAIKNAKYNENGIATVKGVKYKRITKDDATRVATNSSYYSWTDKTYAYFKYEPIKWRVLSLKNGTVMLLSEYGLDDQRYNESCKAITWDKCTLRAWLNSTFLKSAFNAKERKLIKTTKVKNNDSTKGGENTKDKVFLLSIAEVLNTKYGFTTNRNEEDINKRCSPTDFANAMGAWITAGFETAEGKAACWWWLRSPGDYSDCASSVIARGILTGDGGGDVSSNYAVRPAMQLNLSSIIK